MAIFVIIILIAFVFFQNSEIDQDLNVNNLEYDETIYSGIRGEYLFAKTSTVNSKVKVFVSRYEDNLHKIMNWLPDRWDLITVVKSSAYGNDINILGPVASRTVPAVGVMSNQDAAALAPHNPQSILRIGPTNYEMVKDAVKRKLKVQEFIGTQEELEAVTRVAKESKAVIDASLYLFKHYGDPWGFEFDTPEEFQQLVDSVDPELVKVNDIFTHLVIDYDDTETLVNKKIQRFLSVACPVAVKLAKERAPEDVPIRVHWGASSELYRLLNLESGKLEISSDVQSYVDVCTSHPKVKLGIRVGTATFGGSYDIPGLQSVLSWTSNIKKMYRKNASNIAVVNVGTNNGYPRLFQRQGDWGKVSIGGKLYPLISAPLKNQIEINVGKVLDKKVFVGADVCLLCDNLSFEDFYEWSAVDAYNIAMCATGASTHFADATSFVYDETYPACSGSVVIVSSEDSSE